MGTNDNSNNDKSKEMRSNTIFSHIETRTAIAAAFVISLGTFILNYIIGLCEFVYWRAYFRRFNIPLEYFDEAIIPETGTKYVIILYAPLVVVLWWCINAVCKVIKSKFKARKRFRLTGRKKERFEKFKGNRLARLILMLFIMLIYVLLCLIILHVADFFWYKYNDYLHIGMVLFVEIIFYIFSRICKLYFANRYSLSKKISYGVRIILGVFTFYLIMHYLKFSGSLSNIGMYSGGQGVRLVNDLNNSFQDVKAGKMDVEMVLLETEDCYYVTNVELEKTDGYIYKLTMWNVDTYRFIDKVDCSITSIYAHVNYGSSRYKEEQEDTFKSLEAYAFGVCVFIFGSICWFSIPVRKEESVTDAKDAS